MSSSQARGIVEVDTQSVAEKAQQGTYYEESRAWYAQIYHAPLIERSYFIIIILIAFITVIASVNSFISVFPLAPAIPFVVKSDDVFEEVPRMERLAVQGSDRNMAVAQYLIKNYILRRESYVYDPAALERNYNNVRSQSSQKVLDEYRSGFDAKNPGSPFNLYANHTRRRVDLTGLSIEKQSQDTYRARATFTERLEGKRKTVTPEWFADITFNYTYYEVEQDIKDLSLFNFFSIALDVYFNHDKYHEKKKFKVTPMTFVVNQYSTQPKLVER